LSQEAAYTLQREVRSCLVPVPLQCTLSHLYCHGCSHLHTPLVMSTHCT
jgi:hypothetical protein